MIGLYAAFFIVGLVIFFLTGKQPITIRLAIAVGVFAGLSILATLWVAKIGDKPPPGAVTISPNEVGEPSGNPTGKERHEPKAEHAK